MDQKLSSDHDLSLLAEQIQNLNRVYAVLSGINKTIIRVREPQSLFDEVCRIAVEDGNFRMAWIGLLDAERHTVQPVAYAGVVNDYLNNLKISLTDEQRSKGPTAQSLLSGKYVICSDIEHNPLMKPWRENALKLGYRSSISIPFTVFDIMRGSINLYASTPNFFNEREIALLDEMGHDVSFALEQIEKEIQRKLVEQKLVKSEDRYRKLFWEMSNGCALHEIICDAQGTPIDYVTLEANSAFETLLGVKAGDVIGKKISEMLPEDERTKWVKLFGEVALKGISTHYEMYSAANGKFFEGTAYSPEKGKFAVIFSDVTEKKQITEKIREQVSMIDEAPDAIIVHDLADKITYWNKGAEEMYGWNTDEVTGKNIRDILYKNTAQQIDSIYETLHKKGRHSEELSQTRKDGKPISTYCRWVILKNSSGTPKEILSIITDITQRKNLEAQFLRAQRLESLGTLAGGIAHDLNNVLAPILLAIEVIKRSTDNPATLTILETLKSSANRGSTIVQQILGFARGIEGGRSLIQIRHIAKEVESMIKETFPKSITIRQDIPRDTWTINGSATQLHQLLMNLCVNARDAMPTGGVLTISAENCVVDDEFVRLHNDAAPGKYVTIKVNDTGTGIPEEMRERIFEPFFTTKDPGKGTGLGLSTVDAIAKSHRGFITVDSEIGKGSTFNIFFPSSDVAAEDGKKKQLMLPAGVGELILVVDDEASVLQITKQTLEAFGYRVITSLNGSEAVGLYTERRSEIALVLTDIMMPVMNGPAMIQVLHTMNPKLPVITSSGLESAKQRIQTEEYESNAFIAKPYTAEKLLTTIDAVLHGRPQESSAEYAE